MEEEEGKNGCLKLIVAGLALLSVLALINAISMGIGALLNDLGYIGSTLFAIGIIIAVVYAFEYFKK